MDGNQSQSSQVSTTSQHERVAELEAAAERSKLKVEIKFLSVFISAGISIGPCVCVFLIMSG